MIELSQLENLLAVEKYGTLSAAAEHIHLSQPALSRSMQKLEDQLRVSFDRQKNRVSLNATGQLAVEYARRVVEQAGELTRQVRAFDRSRHTISVGSCAPAPLWKMLPAHRASPALRLEKCRTARPCSTGCAAGPISSLLCLSQSMTLHCSASS